MIVSVIVAIARNRVIGAKGTIPWRLPDEQLLFKRLTMGHHLIMGRKTYESIGRLLPGRTTVIVSRRADYVVPGAIVASSFDAALAAAGDESELFVIGGAELFLAALPRAERLHLTSVDAEPAGDTWMPEIDFDEWRLIESHQHPPDPRHAFAYTYARYERLGRRT